MLSYFDYQFTRLRPVSFILVILAATFLAPKFALAEEEPITVPSGRAPVRAADGKNTPALLYDHSTQTDQWNRAVTSSMEVLDLAPIAAEDSINDITPGKPFRVGIHRELTNGPITPADHGIWINEKGKPVVWAWSLRVPGAQALSLHFAELDLPHGTKLVLRGSGQLPPVGYAGKGPLNDGVFWSRTTVGEQLYLEYQDPTGAARPPVILIDKVNHAYRGLDWPRQRQSVVSCQQDINCYSVDAVARDSVGRVLVQDGEESFVCSGSLLSDADTNTYAGYFMTASHCISSQAIADTLEVWWFYETDICDGTPAIGAVSNGAQLLEYLPETDSTLLRLNNDPQDGQGFAAWTTEVPNGTVRGIHHPEGSFKRFSEGTTTTALPTCDPSLPVSRYLYNDWMIGITEGGSSGSPLFNSNWQVVGQYYGICYNELPVCGVTGPANPGDYNNVYGRFQETFPSFSGYLNSVTADDAFEDNDSLGQAPVLGPGSYELRLVDFDDYFTFSACEPLTLIASAAFDIGDMNLDLLLSTDTGTELESSTGGGGFEQVSAALGTGDYRIRATKVSGWGGDYSLTINISGFADCNTNGLPDSCDEDCNENGMPDDCEVVAMLATDCNQNGVPDECDLAAIPEQIAKLTASDANTNGFFGGSVSIDADVAIVTSRKDFIGGVEPGAVYVFRQSNGVWTEVAMLTGADTVAGDAFGSGASIDGNTFVVGANGDDDGGVDSGSAYVFRETQGVWTQIAKLTAADPGTEDRFGSPVAIAGNTIVVGASTDDDGGNLQTGSVYVFREIDGAWTQIAKLTADDAEPSDQFGRSVSIDGNTIVVGAWLDDDAGNDSGSAYIFREIAGNWTQIAKLIGSTLATGASFGDAASISKDTVLIGAYTDDQGSTNSSGSAFVFREIDGVWTELAKLTASDPGAGDFFGISVSLAGDTAVLGAQFDNNQGGGASNFGSAYVFREIGGSWTELAKLTANDAGVDDTFGTSVSMDSHSILVGAIRNSAAGVSSGAAYLFSGLPARDCNLDDVPDECQLANNDCNANGAPDECDIESGMSMDFDSNGVPDECEHDCNSNGIEDNVDITFGTSLDCNDNHVPDTCDIVEKTSEDSDSNGVPDECERDCNSNGIFDGDDIDLGSASDCNNNDIPDECEADCNTNGLADECEITIAPEIDCDQNGVPDSCDLSGIPTQTTRLAAEFGLIGDKFGDSVSIDGDWAVVGAPQDDNSGSGVAFVFQRIDGVWIEDSTLTAGDAQPNDFFGGDVSIDGDTLIVGASRDNHSGGIDSGSAYMFRNVSGTWTEIAKLTANDAAVDDRFGTNVSIDGATVIVGANHGNDGGIESGAAYVFREIGGIWTQIAKLTASDAVAGDDFGISVDLDGKTAIVGAYFDSDSFSLSGSAYVFREIGGTWTEIAKLTADDAGGADLFGQIVSIDQGTAAVGAYFDNDAGGNSGSAYVFREVGGNWVQIAKLTPAEGAAGDVFGIGISIKEDTVLVGASGVDAGGSNRGSAYLFRERIDGWQQVSELTANNGMDDDYFGISVAYDGNSALIGAFQDDNGGAGQAYVFDDFPARDCNVDAVPDVCQLSENDCNTNGFLDVCDISALISTDIDMDASPDECTDPEFFSVWTGLGNGVNWDDPDNWSPMRRPDNMPGGTPPEFYHVTIGSAGVFTVTGPTPNATVESLDIGSDSGTTELDLSTSLTVNQAVNVNTGGLIDLDAANASLIGATARLDIAQNGTVRTSGSGGQAKEIGTNVSNSGEIRVGANQFLTISGQRFENTPDGFLNVRSGAGLNMDSTELAQAGRFDVLPQAVVAITATEFVNSTGATINLIESSLECDFGFRNQAGATVDGVGGSITGMVTNEGVISSDGDLTINGDLVVLPGGIINVIGDFAVKGSISGFDFSLQGGTMSLNPGSGNNGLLDGANLTINDSGTLEMSGSTDIALTGNIYVNAFGRFMPSGPTDGIVTATDVVIGSPSGIGGLFNLGDDISAIVDSVAVGPSSCEDSNNLRGCSPPELQVVASALLIVQGDLSIGGDASITVSSILPVQLEGDFANSSRAPWSFDWLDGHLLLNGIQPRTFEAAGQDQGRSVAGLVNNFAIGKLEIAPAADITFIDSSDNDGMGSASCSEAVYVDTLILRVGSSITLDDTRVYYRRLINEGGTVNTNGCGQLLGIPSGDFDGDGDVDNADYAYFAGCLGGPDSTATAPCLNAFDFELDDDVDLGDFALFANIYQLR